LRRYPTTTEKGERLDYPTDSTPDECLNAPNGGPVCPADENLASNPSAIVGKRPPWVAASPKIRIDFPAELWYHSYRRERKFTNAYRSEEGRAFGFDSDQLGS